MTPLFFTAFGDVTTQLGHDIRTVVEWRDRKVTELAAVDEHGNINAVSIGHIEIHGIPGTTAGATYTIYPCDSVGYIQSVLSPTSADRRYTRYVLEALRDSRVVAKSGGVWFDAISGREIA